MKFACERCGKRFTSVDEPAAGRVYRIRCRCGNVIEITAPREPIPAPKGGMPLRSATPAASAPGPAAAPGAGAPARPATATSPRVQPAAPAPEPRAAPPPAQRTSTLLSHPQATPLSVLSPEAARAAEASGPPLAPPAPSSRAAAQAAPPADHRSPEPALADDPFAVAAAQAARLGNPFDITAPVEQPRKPAAAPSPAGPRTPPGGVRAPAAPSGEAPSDRTGEAQRPEAPGPPDREGAPPPGEEAETSIELSVSEQYPIPVRRRKVRGRGPVVAAAALVLAAGGVAAGLYLWKDRAAAPRPGAASPPASPPQPLVSPPPWPTSPAPAPRAAEATPPAQAPAEAREPARTAEPAGKAPQAKAEPEPRAARRERKEARAEPAPSPRREEPRTAPPAAPPRAATPPPASEPQTAAAAPRPKEETAPPKAQPALPDGLDPKEMQAVISRQRGALEACVEQALADPATASYAGQRVSLLIFVAANGRAELALEDPALDASPFGACLRRVASRMSFPPFRGEPVGARIPLQLGRGG